MLKEKDIFLLIKHNCFHFSNRNLVIYCKVVHVTLHGTNTEMARLYALPYNGTSFEDVLKDLEDHLVFGYVTTNSFDEPVAKYWEDSPNTTFAIFEYGNNDKALDSIKWENVKPIFPEYNTNIYLMFKNLPEEVEAWGYKVNDEDIIWFELDRDY